MITFIVHMRVPQENTAAFEALMADVCTKVLSHESGVAYYGYAHSVEDPQTYVVTEVYHDAQVHAAHMQQPWVIESLPKAAALIDGEPQIRQYVSPGTEPVVQTVG